MSDSISNLQQSLPVLHTRGTHFEVGLDMGRTFSSMIKDFLQNHTGLNQRLLPDYSTEGGKTLYNESLNTLKASFPQYITELEGIAKGAGVDFYKLFLLHLGDLLPHYLSMVNVNIPAEVSPKLESKDESKLETNVEPTEPTESIIEKDIEPTEEPKEEPTEEPTATGCLNIIVNNYYNRYIAHTQDATIDYLNHMYFVDAHIISNEPQGKYKVKEERFISLCYAGLLPGFAMASNHHGLVYSVNKLTPSTVGIGKTPPHFLGRALLSAENIEQAAEILNDEGVGAADGFSLSIASVDDRLRKCFIIEVAPAIIGAKNSLLSMGEIQRGSYAYHANKYLGLEVEEISNSFLECSQERLNAVASYDPPRTRQRLVEIMNDEKIFLSGDSNGKQIRTIVLGVFDLNERSLAIYIDRPRQSEPLFVMPLTFKSDCRIFEN